MCVRERERERERARESERERERECVCIHSRMHLRHTTADEPRVSANIRATPYFGAAGATATAAYPRRFSGDCEHVCDVEVSGVFFFEHVFQIKKKR